MTNNKLRIHIKNNHASSGTFPPSIEGEEVFTITEASFQVACQRFPAVAEQVEAFIDWDLEHFAESMETADVLVTWDFPTTNLAKVAPRLKLIHIYRRRSRASLPDELGSGRCKSGQQPGSSRRERRGVRLDVGPDAQQLHAIDCRKPTTC